MNGSGVFQIQLIIKSTLLTPARIANFSSWVTNHCRARFTERHMSLLMHKMESARDFYVARNFILRQLCFSPHRLSSDEEDGTIATSTIT